MPTQATTTRRGYGWQHQQERDRWRPIVEAGQAECWRCGWPILPYEPWDMGHDDHDRTRYNGPEHISCNRGAGARHGNIARRRPACWCGGRCKLHVPTDQV